MVRGWKDGAITPRQQLEALVQPLRKGRHTHSPYPPCSQFERQGETIQPTTDLRYDSSIVVGQPKRRGSGLCSFHKEMESVVVEEARPIQRPRRIREAHSRDVPDHFSAHQEWLTAGRKECQTRTARQEEGNDISTFLNNMFTVVQHQEQVSGLQIRSKPLDW
jgi:hypothetical protein